MNYMNTVLTGHDSPETAYVVDDYPYGFRLRCSIRYWIDTHETRGQRLYSQTTNPKAGNVWNKPKASTYSPMLMLGLDDKGHITSSAIGLYPSAEHLDAFRSTYGQYFSAWQAKRFDLITRMSQAMSRALATTPKGTDSHV